MAELTGPSAIAVLSRTEPERMVVVRLGNAGGVVIGQGDDEMFVAIKPLAAPWISFTSHTIDASIIFRRAWLTRSIISVSNCPPSCARGPCVEVRACFVVTNDD